MIVVHRQCKKMEKCEISLKGTEVSLATTGGKTT